VPANVLCNAAIHKVASLVLFLGSPLLAAAANLKEPLTLYSEGCVLNILMAARAAPVSSLALDSFGLQAHTGWVYEICQRPTDGTNTCPIDNALPNCYGGTLLHLEKGDTLKIHFVNELPPVFESDHAQEPGQDLQPSHDFERHAFVSVHTVRQTRRYPNFVKADL
jgi:hypothetical protein